MIESGKLKNCGLFKRQPAGEKTSKKVLFWSRQHKKKKWHFSSVFISSFNFFLQVLLVLSFFCVNRNIVGRACKELILGEEGQGSANWQYTKLLLFRILMSVIIIKAINSLIVYYCCLFTDHTLISKGHITSSSHLYDCLHFCQLSNVL